MESNSGRKPSLTVREVVEKITKGSPTLTDFITTAQKKDNKAKEIEKNYSLKTEPSAIEKYKSFAEKSQIAADTISSAGFDMSYIRRQAEERMLQLKGSQAQVETVEHLQEQNKALVAMSDVLSNLLSESTKGAKLNNTLALIAAISGVLSVLLAIVALYKK